MSFDKCLDNALVANLIDNDTKEGMSKLYKSLVDHYGSASAAKAELVDRLMKRAEHERRRQAIDDPIISGLERYMVTYRNARGEPDPAQALISIIEHHGQVGAFPEGMSSVVGRKRALEGLYMARLEALIWEHRRTAVTGKARNVAGLENVVREARGEATGDQSAALLAKAWTMVSDELRQRFNAAGGAIGELKNWGMAQTHDAAKMIRAKREPWIKFIEERIDLAAMKHPLTGKAMTREDLRASLDYIWESKTTDGWVEREVSSARQGLGAIANQRGEHRFLVFKSADAWLEYNAKFGEGDIYCGMIHHVRSMIEDIAAMEVLGTNPPATLTYLSNFVTRQAKLKASGDARLAAGAVFPTKTNALGKTFNSSPEGVIERLWSTDPVNYADKKIKRAEDMWHLYRGTGAALPGDKVAGGFDTVRNINTASLMGSAVFSSLTDPAFQMVARHYNGLPAMKAIPEIAKQFKGSNRREQLAAGFMLDNALPQVENAFRWIAGTDGHGRTGYMADRVIAASGLSAWTQATKGAARAGLAGDFRMMDGKAWSELHPLTQKLFERYGLTPQDWDLIRSVKSHEHAIRPIDVLDELTTRGENGARTAERYAEMIIMESEYMTPEGSLQAKAAAYGGLRRGFLRDEAVRSAGQFKMFAISMQFVWGQRIINTAVEDGVFRGAGMAAVLMLALMPFGALVIQLRNLASGKDLERMDNPKFAGRALLQSGGGGIVGDFMQAEQSRMGQSLPQTLSGPTIGFAADMMRITSGNIGQAIRGEKTNFGRELVTTTARHVPGASLWYTRSAYQHWIVDRLQRAIDPEAYQAWRAEEQRQMKDYGTGFYWPRGRDFPIRTPRYGN